MEQKFKQGLENKVKRTIEEHNLVDKDDKVMVACSGGKDSTTTLYLLKKLGYDTEALIIDLLIGDYSKKNLANVRKFCQEHGIKLHVISIRDEFGYSVCYIQSILKSKGHNLNSCTICGILKRNILNRKSRELGVDKLATGHNLDDAAQTIFMNFMQGNLALSARLGPRTGQIEDSKFVPRVKPLYFCPEEKVEKYSRLKKFPVVYDPCPCSVNAFRASIKEKLNFLEKKEPGVKESIVNNFMRILPQLKEHYKSDQKLHYCQNCGEPCQGKICKACEIGELLKNGKEKS